MSTTGRYLEVVNGFDILQWSGTFVDNGEYKPFSISAKGSFSRRFFDSLEAARTAAQISEAPQVLTITCKVNVPVRATEEQIVEWVRYELHENGSIHTANPLSRHSLEAHDVEID